MEVLEGYFKLEANKISSSNNRTFARSLSWNTLYADKKKMKNLRDEYLILRSF